jgi:hypothetical protein
VTAVTALMVAVTAACTSAGSTPATPSGPTLQLTYRSTDASGMLSTDVVRIQRPYSAVAETSRDGRLVGGFAWSADGVFRVDDQGRTHRSQSAPPAAPGPDGHLDVAVPVALRLGLLTQGPTAHGCTTYESEQPLDGAPFAPPTTRDHTSTCVAPDGRILRDTWTLAAAVVRTRELIATTRVAALPAADPSPLPLAQAVIQVVKDADIRPLFGGSLPAAPTGLHLDRRVASRDLQGATPVLERATASFVGAGHLVVLTVEHALDEHRLTSSAGAPVDLGRLGTGRLRPVYTGLQIRATTPAGLLVTLDGDLPESDLLAYARTLAVPTIA